MFRLILTLLFTVISQMVWADDIVSARFVLPTDRYDHCVLGDCLEYEAIEAIMDDGRILSFRLDEGSVFEDVTPRLVPMGLNGRKAILVVRSYQDRGAALVVLDVRSGQLMIAAESPAIGTAFRWQNPIGIGDFDRDRKLEIAAVITPHIGGKLQLYERQGKKLVADKATEFFSNHKMGAQELDLHEIVDWNRDKTVDIIVPDMTRHELRVISFVSGKAEVIAKRRFASAIKGPVTLHENNLQVPLVDGLVESWTRP
ncbi:hypothetical protein [Terasakiella sp. SH-1]|uniref:hypothetical protein n=1 Tax=Terasakiella sp. SH-1 TaxID=2560057 RepID=UPI0010730D45|nr:hypothetical protein [Terasakiella sp. SH-1]